MPGGGHNDYAGHVFWDMDTWMLPPIMLFHPDMARRMIGSRSRVLGQAKKNADAEGFKGAKFPWEQATTGKKYTRACLLTIGTPRTRMVSQIPESKC